MGKVYRTTDGWMSVNKREAKERQLALDLQHMIRHGEKYCGAGSTLHDCYLLIEWLRANKDIVSEIIGLEDGQ